MADEQERQNVDRRRVDNDEEDATGPDVEAHRASIDRTSVDRDDERDAETDEGRERRR